MPSLARFRTAQDQSVAGFDQALAELRAGEKRGHWIWYVFPQLSGLGGSSMSRAYGIDGRAEAAAYLRDPVLRDRLLTIAEGAANHLRSGVSIERLMGSSIDAMKLVSSLTLFGRIARELEREGLEACGALASIADEILAAAESQGYPPCQRTIAHLQRRA